MIHKTGNGRYTTGKVEDVKPTTGKVEAENNNQLSDIITTNALVVFIFLTDGVHELMAYFLLILMIPILLFNNRKLIKRLGIKIHNFIVYIICKTQELKTQKSVKTKPKAKADSYIKRIKEYSDSKTRQKEELAYQKALDEITIETD